MITFSNSFVTFLREAKRNGNQVARLLLNYHERYSGIGDVYDKVLTDSRVNYLTIRNNGMISYLPAGKEHRVNNSGEWAREGRQEGRPAKVIRQLFTDRALKNIAHVTRMVAGSEAEGREPDPTYGSFSNAGNGLDGKIAYLHITESSFEKFGNQYKAKFLDNGYEFVIRPNTDITDVYFMDRVPGGGPLNDSCMNEDDYMEIYCKCKSVRILTLVDKNGRLAGRALVWNVTHRKHGDIVFMDRIYCSEDYMNDLFLDYASKEGWWRKRSFTSQDNKTTWVNPKTGDVESMHITINTNTDCSLYPYIDTFCYGNDGTLTNSDYDNHQYTYQNTGGDREDHHADNTYDEINDEYISDDDSVYLCDLGERQYRNRTTHADNAVEAYISGTRSDWFYNEDCNIIRLRSDRNRTSEWYYIEHEDIISRADGEYDLRDNCIVCETDGEYYRKSDSNIIKSHGQYYHVDDDNVVYSQTECEYIYLPDRGDVIMAIDGKYYSTDDEAVTQVNGKWFVISEHAPKMIVKVDGKWYDRCDVADVVTYVCNPDGTKTEVIAHYLQKDKRIKFVETHMNDGHGNTRIDGNWYLKADLIKWRNKFYHPNDVRLLVRVVKAFTPKRQLA